eukprot:CAMPEP_0175131830 /NCGR_PEP_ID=MMETSP0087-20121206/6754_1 /TAXON_ID=136419 /ORGANISM="Unknown Unknown, Strain D1" /LENGTH=476 /DNA_ID=CAMNT_0016414151 /DNA_START=83 /DNA_END=1510 /DNA_ORIENTATION=+
MEFENLRVAKLFPEPITRLSSREYNCLPRDLRRQYAEIITELGEGSARAQGLSHVITNPMWFSASEQRVYISAKGEQVTGLLKVGSKRLFIVDVGSKMHEIQPLCVLDFYVHENCQRCGLGKELFEFMLRQEGVQPHKLAYDRPSPKLLNFLSKHYDLANYIPQNNNFVVYHKFFQGGVKLVSSGYAPRMARPEPAAPLESPLNGFSSARSGSRRFGSRIGRPASLVVEAAPSSVTKLSPAVSPASKSPKTYFSMYEQQKSLEEEKRRSEQQQQHLQPQPQHEQQQPQRKDEGEIQKEQSQVQTPQQRPSPTELRYQDRYIHQNWNERRLAPSNRRQPRNSQEQGNGMYTGVAGAFAEEARVLSRSSTALSHGNVGRRRRPFTHDHETPKDATVDHCGIVRSVSTAQYDMFGNPAKIPPQRLFGRRQSEHFRSKGDGPSSGHQSRGVTPSRFNPITGRFAQQVHIRANNLDSRGSA